MLTTGKGTHYCAHCGYDMKAREERLCAACDGDFCEPRKYAPLRELKKDHPRRVAALAKYTREGGCRHRPQCTTFDQHVQRLG